MSASNSTLEVEGLGYVPAKDWMLRDPRDNVQVQWNETVLHRLSVPVLGD